MRARESGWPISHGSACCGRQTAKKLRYLPSAAAASPLPHNSPPLPATASGCCSELKKVLKKLQRVRDFAIFASGIVPQYLIHPKT